MLPTEDQPEDWRRPMSRAETEQEVASVDAPTQLGIEFCNILLDGDQLHLLPATVTDDSLPRWGDFKGASEFLRGLDNVAYASLCNPAVGDPDVLYFKLVSNDIEPSYRVTSPTGMVVDAAAILTLVRCTDGWWRVHHLGDYMLPENIPRQ